MALTPTDAPPSEVVQGDALQWRIDATGYAAADGYTAKVRYIGRTTSLEGTATASGTDWIIDLTAALSATLPGGAVSWQLVVTKTTEVATIARGVLNVVAIPAIGAGSASLSQAERTLQLWKDRAEEQAGDIMAEYEVGGTRRVKRYDPDQIRKQIAYWSSVVAREKNNGRLPATAVVFTSVC